MGRLLLSCLAAMTSLPPASGLQSDASSQWRYFWGACLFSRWEQWGQLCRAVSLFLLTLDTLMCSPLLFLLFIYLFIFG